MSEHAPIAVCLLALVCLVGWFAVILSPGGLAGIQIMHNGAPIHNLEIKIYDPEYSGDHLRGTYTTDGTGLVTFTSNNGDIWFFGGDRILYDFTINGTTYSYSGSRTQIVEVSV